MNKLKQHFFSGYIYRLLLLVLTLLFYIPPIMDYVDIGLDVSVIIVLILLIYQTYNGSIFYGKRKILLFVGLFFYILVVVFNRFKIADIKLGHYVVAQLLILPNVLMEDKKKIVHYFKIMLFIGMSMTVVGYIIYMFNISAVYQLRSVAGSFIVGRHPNSSLYGLVGNSNWQSALSILTMISGLYLHSKKQLKTPWLICVLVFNFMVILLTNSRGGFISSLCLLLTGIFIEDGKLNIKKTLLTLITSVVVITGLVMIKPYVGQPKSLKTTIVSVNSQDTQNKQNVIARDVDEVNESSSIRMTLIESAIKISLRNPLGVGSSNITKEMRFELNGRFTKLSDSLISYTHNVYTQVLVTGGFGLLISLLVYFVLLLWDFVRQKRYKQRDIYILLIFILTCAVYNLFEAFLFMSRNFMSSLFWIVIGYLAIYSSNDSGIMYKYYQKIAKKLNIRSAENG